MANHGVDYLPDYYDFFGLQRDASLSDIQIAFRRMQLQCHPDRFQGLAPELLSQAQRMSTLANEAYAVLHNPDKRAAYDDQLANWKGVLCKPGEVVIDLSKSYFSLPTLLSSLGADPETELEEARKLAGQYSGFDEATYAYFSELASAPEGIMPGARAAWREQLRKKELYLSILEQLLWERMGQCNRDPLPQLNYSDQFDQDARALHEEAIEQLAQHVLLQTAGAQTMLLPLIKERGLVNPDEVFTAFSEKIAGHVARRTALLKPIVAERDYLLEALFAIDAEIDYYPNTVRYTDRLIVGLLGGAKIVWLLFKFEPDSDNVQIVDPPEGVEKLEDMASDCAQEWMKQGFTILTFRAIKGVEYHSQLNRIASLHQKKMETVSA